MADTFAIEIVTPERLVVKDIAEEAQIPGKNGYMGILPGHAPLISELAVGEISYRVHGVTNRIAVAWGFAEVLPNKLTVLAETAERPEEIDVARAEQAKARAEKKLASGNSEEECREALGSIAKAETRIGVAEKR
ncbi:MAG TPA: F0F1 ATP synthase subunit epsilon [Terriglobales bacterium]|nr:F0F1 ATP synthase subunit epsilon [Terriglobales bacterium]